MADWADEKVAELCPDIVLGHDRVNHSRTRHAIATALRELEARVRAEARVAALEEAGRKVSGITWTIAYENKAEREAAEDMAETMQSLAVDAIRSLKTPAEEPTK
jgi:hypothetical protein